MASQKSTFIRSPTIDGAQKRCQLTAVCRVDASLDTRLRTPKSLTPAEELPYLRQDSDGMSATESTMMALGTRAPDFALPDVRTGRTFARDAVAGDRGLLVMFICNHCPFVKHVEKELARLGRDYSGRGIGIVGISPNDTDAYPDDAPPGLKAQAERAGFTFPYLYDAEQDTARAYDAACTPDFFLFGPDRTLVYRGQLDDSRPSNKMPVTGRDLRAALDAVIAGRPVPPDQRASIGCSIKWRKASSRTN